MGLYSSNNPLGATWGPGYGLNLQTPLQCGGVPLAGPYWNMPVQAQPPTPRSAFTGTLRVDVSGLLTYQRNRLAVAPLLTNAVARYFPSWPGTGIYDIPWDSTDYWYRRVYHYVAPYQYTVIQVWWHNAFWYAVPLPFYRYDLWIGSYPYGPMWVGSKVEVEDPGPIGTYRIYAWPINKFPYSGGPGSLPNETWAALPVMGQTINELEVTAA